MHLANRITLRHFLVDDALACCHPLYVACADGAMIAQAVGVLDGAGQNVGDGLDATVRVPGKTGQIILWNVIAEIVQQQERVELGGVAEAERAAQMHARVFEVGLASIIRLIGRIDIISLTFRTVFADSFLDGFGVDFEFDLFTHGHYARFQKFIVIDSVILPIQFGFRL